MNDETVSEEPLLCPFPTFKPFPNSSIRDFTCTPFLYSSFSLLQFNQPHVKPLQRRDNPLSAQTC